MARYRRKKSRGHGMGSGRKMVKKGGSVITSLVAAGPVLIPVALAAKAAQSGGMARALPNFTYEAIGYDMDHGTVDTGKVMDIIVRDGVMIGGAMALRYALKRV